MKVCLNGNVYHLQAGTKVTRSPLNEWPDNIRLDGQQKRKDRRFLSSWAIDRWSQGLGIQQMNVDVASQLYRLWDVDNCDTRYPSQIVLSPAFNNVSIVPSRGNLDLAFEHLGNLYFIETAAGASGAAVCFKFAGPSTLGSFNRIEDGGPSSIYAVHVTGHRIFYAADRGGVGLRKVSGIGSASVLYGTLGDLDTTILPQMSDLGGTIHLLWPKDDKTVEFILANRAAGATLHSVEAIASNVGSYLAKLETDGITMYAQLPQGIYDFDTTPDICVDTGRAQDRNCRQVMFGNDLYFKNKYSLIKYDGAVATSIGYDLLDGLPSDKWGEKTAMVSSWKNIFVAVKGPSYSNILVYENNAWQNYAKIPTGGIWVREMILSDAPDGIDRLWCLFGNHNYPGYFLNPMVNPLQAATYSYVPTGHFTPPIFDGGMSEIAGGFYDTALTADGIGGSNNIIMLYGLNGDNPVTTLGVVSTTSGLLTFGSPYGVEGYRIQPKFMLCGANSGTTPIYRNAILHYLKIPKDREEFDFTIDLKETASRIRPLEAIIGSLNSERSKKTLMPFWYGQIGTKVVKVMNMPSIEDIEEDEIFEGERSGLVKVKVAEIL